MAPKKLFQSPKKLLKEIKDKLQEKTAKDDDSEWTSLSSDEDDRRKSPVAGTSRPFAVSPKPRFQLVGEPRETQGSSDTDSESESAPDKESASETDTSGNWVTATSTSNTDDEEHQKDKPQKKKGGKPQGWKTEHHLTFLENLKTRTKVFKDRGGNLQRKAAELNALTGAKMFLKMEFKGGRPQPYYITYGEYFAFEEQLLSPQERSQGPLKELVYEGVKEAMKNLQVTTPGTKAKSTADSVVPMVSIISPLPNRRKTKRPDSCVICSQEDDDHYLFDHDGKRSKIVPTIWLLCSSEVDGNECKYRAHADCLGFPGVDESKAIAMPDWFCPVHLEEGRKLKNVKVVRADGHIQKKGKRAPTETPVIQQGEFKRPQGRPRKTKQK